MRKKIFTFLLALAASVGLMNAAVVIKLNADFTGWWTDTEAFTDNGDGTASLNVTLTAGEWHFGVMVGGDWVSDNAAFSRENPSRVIAGYKPEMSFLADIAGTYTFTWEYATNILTIGYPPATTYTVAQKAGTANADKVTLSATSAIEGATVTVTPNEDYEITAFSAKYNTTEEAPSTLDPETGAYSFTMPAFAVTIEATIALKPVPQGDIYAGFTATAGSGGFYNEGHANLVDNKFTSGDEGVNWTKWCVNFDHMSVPTGESEYCWWIDFEASEALNPTGYILTTGNDTGTEHGRNPKNWVLKAKLDANDAWTTIATVTNDVTMKNQSFKDYKFFVDQSGTYKYFRFEVLAEQGAGVMQLCELRLIGAEPVVVTANTLQLHVNDALMGSVAVTNLLGSGIVDNGDGTYDVPEGAEVTLQATPNEGYEFIGWKASSSICDFNDCEFTALPTVDNPLTFDMYNEAAFMAEFAAVAPQPQPVTDPITPYADPQDASVYYSTFYDSNFKYELPADVEAYVADLSGANLLLTKIAEAGEVIPANVAVILKATVTPFTLTPSDAEAVTFTATNDLQGSDTQIATPANCYVLAGTDGVVGFYHYTAANLNAHKAYVVYSGSNQAPRRMPFIFDQATGVENVQNSDIRSQKVVENGQLIIIRNGVRYNAAGQNVK